MMAMMSMVMMDENDDVVFGRLKMNASWQRHVVDVVRVAHKIASLVLWRSESCRGTIEEISSRRLFPLLCITPRPSMATGISNLRRYVLIDSCNFRAPEACES